MKSLAHARDQQELLARLRQLRPDSERRFGRMSAHQMLCHLADNFRMALGHKAATSPTGLVQQTLLKWFVLYAPVRWQTGNPTAPELDQQGEGTRPSDFSSDVAQVEALMRLMTAPTRSLMLPHPVFGPMSEAAWLRWAYLHTDHHLRQFGA